MSGRERPLYAVLIDADNIPAKYAGAILKEITALGEPALRRVYGDWSSGRLDRWAKEVRDLGLVAHQETANTTGKNASDIGLVIDAMDILHTGRFDGFVLVSSDSDFTALANRIREQGLDVIGIGEAKAPESLRKVCNRFILIENIVEEESEKDRPGAPSRKTPLDALKLILKVMEKQTQEDDWFSLGQLGHALTAEYPDFDTRTYGKRKLSDLITELKRFQTKREGNQLFVRRAD
jgi:hypothetical protein